MDPQQQQHHHQFQGMQFGHALHSASSTASGAMWQPIAGDPQNAGAGEIYNNNSTFLPPQPQPQQPHPIYGGGTGHQQQPRLQHQQIGFVSSAGVPQNQNPTGAPRIPQHHIPQQFPAPPIAAQQQHQHHHQQHHHHHQQQQVLFPGTTPLQGLQPPVLPAVTQFPLAFPAGGTSLPAPPPPQLAPRYNPMTVDLHAAQQAGVTTSIPAGVALPGGASAPPSLPPPPPQYTEADAKAGETLFRPPPCSTHMIIAERFRTQMCINFTAKGKCGYRSRCMFAHGASDLRTMEKNYEDGIVSEEAIAAFFGKGPAARKEMKLKPKGGSKRGQTNEEGGESLPLAYDSLKQEHPNENTDDMVMASHNVVLMKTSSKTQSTPPMHQAPTSPLTAEGKEVFDESTSLVSPLHLEEEVHVRGSSAHQHSHGHDGEETVIHVPGPDEVDSLTNDPRRMMRLQLPSGETPGDIFGEEADAHDGLTPRSSSPLDSETAQTQLTAGFLTMFTQQTLEARDNRVKSNSRGRPNKMSNRPTKTVGGPASSTSGSTSRLNKFGEEEEVADGSCGQDTSSRSSSSRSRLSENSQSLGSASTVSWRHDPYRSLHRHGSSVSAVPSSQSYTAASSAKHLVSSRSDSFLDTRQVNSRDVEDLADHADYSSSSVSLVGSQSGRQQGG